MRKSFQLSQVQQMFKKLNQRMCRLPALLIDGGQNFCATTNLRVEVQQCFNLQTTIQKSFKQAILCSYNKQLCVVMAWFGKTFFIVLPYMYRNEFYTDFAK